MYLMIFNYKKMVMQNLSDVFQHSGPRQLSANKQLMKVYQSYICKLINARNVYFSSFFDHGYVLMKVLQYVQDSFIGIFIFK